MHGTGIGKQEVTGWRNMQSAAVSLNERKSEEKKEKKKRGIGEEDIFDAMRVVFLAGGRENGIKKIKK